MKMILGFLIEALMYFSAFAVAAHTIPGVPAILAAYFTNLTRDRAGKRAQKAADK